ncbi:helix-turn-helix domain-containing protein [Dysgonomonas gadei]|uniref:Helix-turn-helix domain-containing protein n=1 Tax=Dysgonomonas gadei ATCC BAA-286 TaxID=742766 RepID=F5J2B4_9BACT|nr:helix-turn-helix domain-containing protein [Dysgonomonas gadei]EGK00149.1 hypothetical protein HMPREF9455_03481 [Dysgonomonas gadei ATCC BAA-286]
MEQIKDKIDKCMILIMERFDKLENKLEKLYETNNIKDTDLLDDSEAQSLLNVSKRTLQRYKQQKLLPHSKVKGKSYYLGFDIIMFKRGRMNKI